MIGEKRPLSATTFAEGNVSGIPSPSTVILDRQDHPTHDPMQAVEARSAGSKRKSVCDSATGVDLAPCAMKSTVTTNECASLSSVAENQGVQGANGASTIGGRKREVDDLNISCLQGSTMRIPLGGKTVPFRIARRRGSGISSVVFECERIDDGGVGGIGDIGGDGGGGDREADGGPQVVTVKVMSGGETGMSTCLREVETLAFLKVKSREAGLTSARFAELASWFYRRSAIGGVDHVCLVFRGGGVSLHEAMEERAKTGTKQSAWKLSEIVAVARGLLEGLAFLHSVGLIHADLKPENVALYPPVAAPAVVGGTAVGASSSTPAAASSCADNSPTLPQPPSVHPPPPPSPLSGLPLAAPASSTPPACGPTSASVPSSSPFDLRLIDLGNAVFAADAIPGVTAGTPSYLSPEAREGRPWGTGVDVWAAGCVLYKIITGGKIDSGALRSAEAGAPGGPPENDRSSCSGKLMEGLVGLVERLLEVDPDKRPKAREALKDRVFLLA